MTVIDHRQRMREARELLRQGRQSEGRAALEALVAAHPGAADVAILLSRVLREAGEITRAETVLAAALAADPSSEPVATEQAALRAGAGRLGDAIAGLRTFVAGQPKSPLAWLLLGQMLDDAGARLGALRARFEALQRAHEAGAWQRPETTPPHMQALVAAAVRDVHEHRGDIFRDLVDELRERHGADALARVERAVRGYLGDASIAPADPMQRPRFLYFPDLPATPFLDPMLQPWAPRLRDAFAVIRDEALSLLPGREGLEDFVQVREGDRIGNYLGGVEPAWEAFFFYRHGERYDANHERCTRTSAVLESLDLCRIPGQTPEICFSVLKAGTHILPHHGVTNTRVVMHLPLIVPADCALNLVDRGTHAWRAGELVMFDDTYLHEAWNRSAAPRVILLMDCWNPHLTAVEREAVTRLAQTIGALDVALDAAAWRPAPSTPA